MIGIGKNDRNGDYVPTQVLIPQLINAIRQTEARINEITSFLKEEIPEFLKQKYETKIKSLNDTKYMYIYSIIDLKYDIDADPIYSAEIKELLGDTFYSNIQR